MMSIDAQPNRAFNPDQALQELSAGNRRFSLGAGIHPNQTLYRRDEIVPDQHPFAAIFGCSDSRVSPEIIFDCGLGDLFVVRSAGHSVDEAALASLQYATGYLGVKLILVLGHSNCGTIKAAIESMRAPGPLGSLLGKIQPAVTAASGRAGDPLDNAVIENIHMTLARLKEEEWAKELMIVGAYYDLKSGLVTLDPGA